MKVELKIVLSDEERETIMKAMKIMGTTDDEFPREVVEKCDEAFDGLAYILNMDDKGHYAYEKEYGPW